VVAHLKGEDVLGISIDHCSELTDNDIAVIATHLGMALMKMGEAAARLAREAN
jgi:hypothetical protein